MYAPSEHGDSEGKDTESERLLVKGNNIHPPTPLRWKKDLMQRQAPGAADEVPTRDAPSDR